VNSNCSASRKSERNRNNIRESNRISERRRRKSRRQRKKKREWLSKRAKEKYFSFSSKFKNIIRPPFYFNLILIQVSVSCDAI
jgi:hypothetical protein